MASLNSTTFNHAAQGRTVAGLVIAPKINAPSYSLQYSNAYDLSAIDAAWSLSPWTSVTSPSFYGEHTVPDTALHFAAVVEANLAYAVSGEFAPGSVGYTLSAPSTAARVERGLTVADQAGVSWSGTSYTPTVTAGADTATGTPTFAGGLKTGRAATVAVIVGSRAATTDPWAYRTLTYTRYQGAAGKSAISRAAGSSALTTIKLGGYQLASTMNSYRLSPTVGSYRTRPSLAFPVTSQVTGTISQGYTLEEATVHALMDQVDNVTAAQLDAALDAQEPLPDWSTLPGSSISGTDTATVGGTLWGQATGFFASVRDWLWAFDWATEFLGGTR